MTFSNAFKSLDEDLHNQDLPRDFDRAEKFLEGLPVLKPGTLLKWYYQEDLDYFLELEYEDDPDTKDESYIDACIEWSYGTLIPVPDVENRGGLDARDCEFDRWVVVVDRYCTEKCYPEVEWVAFNRLLDADNLVKVAVDV